VAEIDVRFRGLKELDRALGKADKTLRAELRDRLRGAATTVATEARAIAETKGLRKSGDLIRGIRPFVQAGRAGVRSSAVHGGYAYSKRLEYEGRTGGKYGPRATLNPAVEDQQDEIFGRMERLLDDINDDLAGGT
jgi:hypothetical protein